MPQNVYPILQYRNVRAATSWLAYAFGFEVTVLDETPDGDVGHAEMRCGDGLLMLSAARADGPFGDHAGHGWAYVVVEDATAHHHQASDAGAEIVVPLTDQEYGSRDYSARDPEGNLWSFGTYAPDRVGASARRG
jgi:uncharacterized glyoxalase superfamily protein PhnB